MDNTAGSISIWPLVAIGLCAAIVAWEVAKRKGRDRRLWAVLCFLFAPALIVLAFIKSKRQPDPPAGVHRRWSSWWWRVPIGLFGLWLLLSLLWPSGSSSFPTCAAGASHELVRQALEQGEDAKIRNTRLLALDEVRELSHDPKKPERYCSGLAALNSGERPIAWRLYQRGNNLLVEVFGS